MIINKVKNISDISFRTLLRGCKDVLLREDFRKILARDSEHYFIKTHELPYTKYFDGEYVVQIVRNPGLCFWSLYNFRREKNKTYDKSLTDLIKGEINWRSWSDYHYKWQDTADFLKERYLLIRYEDIYQNEMAVCKKLSKFINLPIIYSNTISFNYYHNKFPLMFRQGLLRGWEKYYSKKQLKLLWKLHGKNMSIFGYPEPKYYLGLEKEMY